MDSCDTGASAACDFGVQVPGVCPAEFVSVSWEDWMDINLMWPAIVHASITVLCSLTLAPLHRRLYTRKVGCYRDFLKTYIGTKDQRNVVHGGYMAIICCTQFASSVAIIVVWISNVYRRSVTSGPKHWMLAASCIDLLNWTIHRLQGGWSITSLCEFNSIIDFLTIIPAFQQGFSLGRASTCAGNWLSLHFLRSYSVLYNFMQIQATGQLRHAAVLTQMVMLAILRVVALILIMAGTIFTLEILGDPDFLEDNFVQTPGGDNISFFQMVYWIVISITTVGYGDFAPRTLMSRIFTSMFIVVGVGYVFWVQFQFQQAWVNNREGSGTYTAHKGEQHVVVVLCHRGRTKVFASLIGGFLDEILHNSHKKWPNVIIFSNSLWDEDSNQTFQDFLRERGCSAQVRDHVWFIVGEIASKKDLDRAGVGTSQLTFLIPDINTLSPDLDDERIIFASLVIRDYFPETRLRLMLVRPQSKDIAVQAGIEMARCFSLRELKAHIMAQNVRCHGMLPLITGLLTSADSHDMEVAMRYEGLRARRESLTATSSSSTSSTYEGSIPEVPWMQQYVQGLQRSLFGFELAEEHTGMTFSELVSRVYETSGALIIGAYLDGRIQICPQGEEGLSARTICFAVTASPESLEPCRAQDTEPDAWRKKLQQQRDQQQRHTRRQGTHTVAKQLLGVSLREALNSRRDSVKVDGDDPDPEELDGADEEGREAQDEFEIPQDLPAFRSQSKESRNSSEQSCPIMQSRDSYVGAGKPPPRTSIRRRASSYRQPQGVGHSASIVSNASAASRRGGLRSGSKLHQRKMSRVFGPADFAPPRADEDELTQEVRRLRETLNPDEELVVLVVCHGEVWQQVRTFIGAMRAKYVHVIRPIIVMTPTAMPSNLLDGVSDRVLCIQGSCTHVLQMVEAGMLEASSIVVMTGEVPKSDVAEASLYKDTKVSLCSQLIECWCGISAREVFTTYELQDSLSVSHLPSLSLRPSVKVEEMLSELSITEELDEIEDAMIHRMSQTRSDLIGGSGGERPPKADEAAVHAPSILFNVRFAAGQVFTPELWGAMLGRMFYMPAIIELVEALVMPHRRGQRAFPWQIRVPPRYIGANFVQLVTDMASCEWLNHNVIKRTQSQLMAEDVPELPEANRRGSFYLLGMLPRTNTPKAQPRALAGECKRRRVDPNNVGPGVALALYRRRAELKPAGAAAGLTAPLAAGTGGFNYIVLGPAPDTVLMADDWVLCLGSRRFGKKAFAMGLLRGAVPDEAPAPDVPESPDVSMHSEAGQCLWPPTSQEPDARFEKASV